MEKPALTIKETAKEFQFPEYAIRTLVKRGAFLLHDDLLSGTDDSKTGYGSGPSSIFSASGPEPDR